MWLLPIRNHRNWLRDWLRIGLHLSPRFWNHGYQADNHHKNLLLSANCNQINYSNLLLFDKKGAYFSNNFNIITILRKKHCDWSVESPTGLGGLVGQDGEAALAKGQAIGLTFTKLHLWHIFWRSSLWLSPNCLCLGIAQASLTLLSTCVNLVWPCVGPIVLPLIFRSI